MKLSTLADWIVSAEPRLGKTRLVLIDGPSGSGKTTLAYALSGS
ncbi:MAG TPA: uridine kinase, partial [Micromonosporaceae bacterium]|nr:uridine kinase [Micromonosporaceae bacterium]